MNNGDTLNSPERTFQYLECYRHYLECYQHNMTIQNWINQEQIQIWFLYYINKNKHYEISIGTC